MIRGLVKLIITWLSLWEVALRELGVNTANRHLFIKLCEGKISLIGKLKTPNLCIWKSFQCSVRGKWWWQNPTGKFQMTKQFGLILRKWFYERENEKFRGNTFAGDCFRSFFEFSQTFMIVSMTRLRTGWTCFIFLFVNTARNFSDSNHELLFSNSQNPELALGVRRSSCFAVSILTVTCWSTSENHEI